MEKGEWIGQRSQLEQVPWGPCGCPRQHTALPPPSDSQTRCHFPPFGSQNPWEGGGLHKIIEIFVENRNICGKYLVFF